ncbi:MAG: hypothetical protein KGL44_01510 [Sphingomonadales bacterium]|nr:hypothetical protein [Sphingomonadales bacterium]
MIDKSRPAQRPALPAFTPVPRRHDRFDGWTPERQSGFVEALADTGSVKAAAHAVNMTPESAYALRRHPQAGSFRKAWEAALALGVQRLEDLAMDRALNGVEVPVYSYGKLVGSRTVYNDRLLMFILRNRAPTRFAPDGRVTARRSSIADPAEANRLARLKKQWRKEWEEEVHQPRTREQADRVCESINAKLSAMHRNWWNGLSPRTRELYNAYRESEEADKAAGYIAPLDDEDELPPE